MTETLSCRSAQDDKVSFTLLAVDCAVYIMTNRHRSVLYVGVTSSLRQRLAQHRAGVHPSSFTKRYNVDRLVYYEISSDIKAAIGREKQLKGWRRDKKTALIDSFNPEWNDLAADDPPISG